MLLFCTISPPSSGAEECHYKGAWPPVKKSTNWLVFCNFSSVLLSFLRVYIFPLFHLQHQLIYLTLRWTNPLIILVFHLISCWVTDQKGTTTSWRGAAWRARWWRWHSDAIIIAPTAVLMIDDALIRLHIRGFRSRRFSVFSFIVFDSVAAVRSPVWWVYISRRRQTR